MDLILTSLREKYQLKELSGAPGSWFYTAETPAHKFLEIIKPAGVGKRYYALSLQDEYPERLLKSVLDFIANKESEIYGERPIQVLEFGPSSANFDRIVVLGAQSHNKYKVDCPPLHPTTLVVFPAYKSEFTGKEDLNEIKVLRKDIVPTLDWKRSPSPKILLRFKNTKTGSETIGKKRKLAPERVLMNALATLTDEPGSFVEVENYEGDICNVVARKGGEYVASCRNGRVATIVHTKDQLLNWVREFVVEGLSPL
jgi:hypothetical protein